MATRLTNHKVFEPAFDEATGEFAQYRFFLPSAEMVQDIHLSRIPGTEGQVGNALVDIPQRFVVHSPTGFEWGYGGSGPADLALNILGLFVPPQEAWRLHQQYKWDVIAGLSPEGPHTIEAAAVRAWLRERWAIEDAKENDVP